MRQAASGGHLGRRPPTPAPGPTRAPAPRPAPRAQGYLSVNLSSNYYFLSQRFPEAGLGRICGPGTLSPAVAGEGAARGRPPPRPPPRPSPAPSPQVPRLTQAQLDALELVESLAASGEFSLSYQMQPGERVAG